MRAILGLLILLAGCSSATVSLRDFPGWSWERTSGETFRIYVGEVKTDRVESALRFAAILTLQKGYRAFSVLDDDGKGESGTWFGWSDGYDPQLPGIWNFEPGRYFLIRCRHKPASNAERWFSPERFLSVKKPNQAPEPTRMLVTPRADARVAPSTRVAHL